MRATPPQAATELARSALRRWDADAVWDELESLQRVTALHRALATRSDLVPMLEAFSEWLRPHVEHAVLGLVRTGHEHPKVLVPRSMAGVPELAQVTERLTCRDRPDDAGQVWQESGLVGLFWPMPLSAELDRFMVVRHGPLEHRARRILNEGVCELREPLRRAAEFNRVYELARCDALTGLPNRRVLDEMLDQIHESAQRYAHPAVLVSLDLDHFKQVNDCYGHDAGDRVLVAAAQAMSKTVRSTDLLVRLGGDEFAIVLPDTEEHDALALVERLREAVASLAGRYPQVRGFGLSAGLAPWRGGASVAQWSKRADEALYRDKLARAAVAPLRCAQRFNIA